MTQNINEYTLEELEKESGTKIRTIRFYISEGLLTAPSAMGPKARYSNEHLLRLKVIERLKLKLRLNEIKQVLADRSIDLKSLLDEAGIGDRPLDSASLKKMMVPGFVGDLAAPPQNFSFAAIGSVVPSMDIYSRLQPEPEPEHETWQRLRPVEGIEIQIRDDVDPKTRELVLQLVGQLRKHR